MSDIYYLYTEGLPSAEIDSLPVSYEGVKRGKIEKVSGGYRFVPRFKECEYPVFKSIKLVQEDLGERFKNC